MAIKNIKTLLTQATNFPAAVEAKLPEGNTGPAGTPHNPGTSRGTR